MCVLGRVLAHPALQKFGLSQEVLTPVQIDQLEVRREFSNLKRRILTQERGCYSISTHPGNNVVCTKSQKLVFLYFYCVIIAVPENIGHIYLEQSWGL